jgi:hypothetical protein
MQATVDWYVRATELERSTGAAHSQRRGLLS